MAATGFAPLDTAILLAAGEGSRLRSVAASKPLCPVAGRPLVDHALERLSEAGVTRAVVVTGYLGAELERHLSARGWPLAVETVRVDDWTMPNGVSALAGARAAGRPALLAMCDHLVDPALYRLLAQVGPGPGLTLGIDRRLSSDLVDLDDVTRVATDGGRVVAIGKGMADYDSFDTGVFAIDDPFVAALAALESPSITEGVRVLAAQGRAAVRDVGSLGWIDVDDSTALAQAERWMVAQTARAA